MNDEIKKYTVISLFAGAGGLDCGIHQTGRFKILASVDFNKNCCEALKANRGKQGNGLVIHADLSADSPKKVSVTDKRKKKVGKLNPLELLAKLNLKPGEVDLIVGGSPCQSFSRAGKREGLNNPKGQLIYDYLRFVNVIKPKMFLFENVKGILDDKIEDSIRVVIEDLAKKAIKVGYEVQGWLLNSANYGVPQSLSLIHI